MRRVPEVTVGTDLVSVSRFKWLLSRYGLNFSKQIFTLYEMESYNRYPLRLAARLAGKEAVGKALGVGLAHMHQNGVPATDIEIYNLPSGAPSINLYGRAAALMERQGICVFNISLSHNLDYATAVVIGVIADGSVS